MNTDPPHWAEDAAGPARRGGGAARAVQTQAAQARAGERDGASAAAGFADVPLAGELSVVFARMAGVLLSEETVGTSLELITALALDTVPGADGAGMSLIDDSGRRTSTAATDDRVRQADAMQYELSEGPCLSAWGQRAQMRIDDTSVETRWPRWCGQVQQLGVRSVLSAPLIAGDRAVGAMKVYSDKPGGLGDRAERLLGMLAPQGAVLLANVQSHQAATELSEGLKQALHSRDVIATAKGILMARDGADEQTAFTMLVSASQREHRKLRDVAQDIVSSTARRRS